MNKKTILGTFIALILTIGVFLIWQSNPIEAAPNPKTLYKVYLDKEVLGYLETKEELDDYINKSQKEIKAKYGVSRVYSPKDLIIEKEITYNKNILSAKEIYDKIKKKSPFTVDGYKITISGTEVATEQGTTIEEAKNIYTVDENLFEEATRKTVNAFISKEDYENYVNGTQKEIKDYGSKIEELKILNNISIKKAKVSVEEKIFLNSEDLSQYLLFGSDQTIQDYYVKDGDNIEDIALITNYQRRVLIANPQISSKENSIIYIQSKRCSNWTCI